MPALVNAVRFWPALLLCMVSVCRGQSIALSFDDGFDSRQQSQAAEWNAAILNALDKAHVKSILFAAGARVDSPAGLSLVQEWARAGHTIGNHTYAHLNFGSPKTSLETFVGEIEKNEALLKSSSGWTKRFRFPYLKEGETETKRNALRNWLVEHDYRTGAVSIDASDWYYNSRYLAWRDAHPLEDATPFRSAYLEHLWGRAGYYDSLSRQVLGRSAKHVLLLHTNAINAAFLSDVIAMFRQNGWTLITPDEAYADPVYAMKPNVLPAGESILWALAKQNFITGLRYPAEDEIYEKPLLDKLGF